MYCGIVYNIYSVVRVNNIIRIVDHMNCVIYYLIYSIYSYIYMYNRVKSRDEFAMWCCEMHNDVNEKLHKQTYPCKRDELRERWYVNTKEKSGC